MKIVEKKVAKLREALDLVMKGMGLDEGNKVDKDERNSSTDTTGGKAIVPNVPGSVSEPGRGV